MPYDIRKSGSGYKVGKKGSSKTFSKKPLSKERAKKQMAAIYANSNESFEAKLNAIFETGLMGKPMVGKPMMGKPDAGNGEKPANPLMAKIDQKLNTSLGGGPQSSTGQDGAIDFNSQQQEIEQAEEGLEKRSGQLDDLEDLLSAFDTNELSGNKIDPTGLV